jgi:hypothetical protein
MVGQGSALGVLEQAMRAALNAAGARLLEAVLADGDDGYAGPHVKCGAGHQAGYAGRRPKTVSTVLGPVQVTRAWYHCRECERGSAPRDEQLGVAGTSLSPGLTQMIARAGSEVPFGKAAALVKDLAGIAVTAKTIERSAEASGAAARKAGAAEAVALRARKVRPLPPPEPVPDMLYVEVDGTGVPVRASETEGRPGKGEDGKAGTREIKLARFFTVSALDDDGNPVLDPGSSSYVATFDGKDALAGLVEAEYLRRGGEHFRQVVALGDGAAWIWAMAGALYPHATHITDIWHAREHLHDLAAHLAFITPTRPNGWPAAATNWTPATSRRSSPPPASTRWPASRPMSGTRSSATSSATPTGCATSTSAISACLSGPAPSKAESRRSSASALNSQACTGPPMAPPTSSPCAASTPAAAGTNSGPPAPPSSGQPSDRPSHSDPLAAVPGKIISNKALPVHAVRAPQR